MPRKSRLLNESARDATQADYGHKANTCGFGCDACLYDG